MKDNVVRWSETAGMKNLTLLVTGKCTLRCKLYATYSPYIKKPVHYSLETLTKSVDRFFDCIRNQIGIVTVSGGEPLLHPQIAEFMSHVNKYSDRIKMLEIVTNGTIVPDKKLLAVLSTLDKLNVLLDNYGEKLSPKIPLIKTAFESNSIQYRLRNYTLENSWFGGWVDVSDFSEKNRSDDEAADIYSKCEFNNIYSDMFILSNGKACICYANKESLDFVEEAPDEFVDLMDYSLSKTETEKQLLELKNRRFRLSCRNCNGFFFENEHKIPGEQI